MNEDLILNYFNFEGILKVWSGLAVYFAENWAFVCAWLCHTSICMRIVVSFFFFNFFLIKQADVMINNRTEGNSPLTC